FFFSSRRRHTRCLSDWSSDVCSSDLTLVGTVTADGAGSWSYTLTAGQALAQGGHTATATAVDAAGNRSAPSGAASFTVDLTAPPPPLVQAPADGAHVATLHPTISGTAESGAAVQVTV